MVKSLLILAQGGSHCETKEAGPAVSHRQTKLCCSPHRESKGTTFHTSITIRPWSLNCSKTFTEVSMCPPTSPWVLPTITTHYLILLLRQNQAPPHGKELVLNPVTESRLVTSKNIIIIVAFEPSAPGFTSSLNMKGLGLPGVGWSYWVAL